MLLHGIKLLEFSVETNVSSGKIAYILMLNLLNVTELKA